MIKGDERMKKRPSLWTTFLKKGFALFTILMMLGQLGQGAVTVLAQELAVGDNGAWMLLLISIQEANI